MTTYTMEARENYPAAQAAEIDAGTLDPAGFYRTYGAQLGTSYSPQHREFIYAMEWVDAPSPYTGTNSTGFTLWMGSAPSVPNLGTYDLLNLGNYNNVRKSIDTDSVTYCAIYDPASTVPNGVDGSDGTWRRIIESSVSGQQGPKINDIRTGNMWVHMTGSGCRLHCFRREDDYAMTLSPLDDEGMAVWGINADWTFVSRLSGTDTHLIGLVPRERAAEEVTADHLLYYAEFDSGLLQAETVYSTCAGGDEKLYVLALGYGGATWEYSLLQLTQPTSAPYGGPTVGGGWATVTPWGVSDGLNTGAADYSGTPAFGDFDWQANKLMWLHQDEVLVCMNCLWPQAKFSTDPLDWALRVGYYNPATTGWTYIGPFVSGYMTAAWAMTSDPAAAAWAIKCNGVSPSYTQASIRWSDQYRDYNSVDLTTLPGLESDDDSVRMIVFEVNPVAAGVIDDTKVYTVFTWYQFADGAAPVLTGLLAIPETGWDAAYSAYGTAIGNAQVVQASAGNRTYEAGTGEVPWRDDFLWDAANSAIWNSGLGYDGAAYPFFQFDPAFADREGQEVYPPILRLSLSDTPPPATGRRPTWVAMNRIRIPRD